MGVFFASVTRAQSSILFWPRHKRATLEKGASNTLFASADTMKGSGWSSSNTSRKGGSRFLFTPSFRTCVES